MDYLNKLINPKTIAVIGASNKEGKVGQIIFTSLLKSKARVFPVNPKETEVLGTKSYTSITSVPEAVDVAVITLRAETAVGAAEECAAAGAAVLIIVAGGFAETGGAGRDLEERLRALVGTHSCRILGPNTLGIFVPENKLDTIFVEHGDKSLARGGGIAFITQSGSIGVESLGLAGNTGFGMRAFVGLGNKTDMHELDFLRYFGSDEKTDCLAFYIENFDEGRTFLSEAREISCSKPIVILKSGRTPKGATAVSSHTGRLAGSDRVVSGAFRQFGIQRAYDDEELCDAAKTLSMLPPAKGNRIAVLTPAGGFGVMCTDYIEEENNRAPLRMAELSGKTIRALREICLGIASVRNPVDLTAGVDNEMFLSSLQAILDDPAVDIIISITLFSPPGIREDLIDKLSVLVRNSAKPVLIFTQYGPFTDGYLKQFYQKGMIGFPSINRVVRAARFLVERGEIVRSREGG